MSSNPTMRYVVNIEEPEMLDTTETPTRQVTARLGPIKSNKIDFRGYIIADINPTTATRYAKEHLRMIKGKRAHILAAVASENAKDEQGVGVVCFGDLHENLDRGLVSKVLFPFKIGDDVVRRELAAIRHALQEGTCLVWDREDGDDDEAVKVKTLTIVTAKMEALTRILGYNMDKEPKKTKLCYRTSTLLRDIAEMSSSLAAREVAVCLYYAPEDSTGPLTLAAAHAGFGNDIDGIVTPT